MTNDILFTREGRLGLVTLNRPQALNALTREMIGTMHRQLLEWAADPEVEIVAVEGAGERAFCAGGDIVSLHRAGQSGNAPVEPWNGFFHDEYRLNQAIAHYPKPYVALVDGVSMGGGVGISVHAPYRIATERTLFAMPEVAIGLIPDVGATHALPRFPGELGTWLALTDARIRGADAVHVGYCTHFVPSVEIAALKERLAHSTESVDHVLKTFDSESGAPNSLATLQDGIDYHFSQNEVEEILESLDQGDDWAMEQAARIRTMSPTSLKLTLHALREGEGGSLEDALRLEYRIVSAIRSRGDFYEGVRARLIDKDNAPRWQPASLTEVDIAPYLERPADGDLDFD